MSTTTGHGSVPSLVPESTELATIANSSSSDLEKGKAKQHWSEAEVHEIPDK
jgi:hypothetical protein